MIVQLVQNFYNIFVQCDLLVESAKKHLQFENLWL